MKRWKRSWVGLTLVGLVVGCAPGELPESDGPLEAAVDASWQGGVERALAEREYHASRNREGLQAPNRAQGFRTYFDETGIRMVERGGSEGAELARLSLAAVGRGDRLEPVGSGEVVHEGPRVEIRRPGFVEWYLNSEAGLEQGFTIDARPAGEGEVVVALAVEGARASLRGDEVVLDTGARRLSYGKLVAFDARERRLPAEFAIEGGRVRIELDDAGAEYPVVIDPLIAGTWDAVLESDRAGSGLGLSVAGAGDVNGDGYDDVIVGAWTYDNGVSNEGAAFVFLGSAAGIATTISSLADSQIESDQANAFLGRSVGGAGDVNGDGYDDVIVGAFAYDAGEPDEGAAFVFLGSATGVLGGGPAAAHAQLESNQSGSSFGFSVAGAGDVNGDGYSDVIVGGDLYDNGEVDEGAAFIFLGSAAGIADGSPATAHARLESNQVSARLGVSAAGAGDVNGDGFDDVVVGSMNYSATHSFGGAAFVFLGSASGVPDADPATAHARLESDQASASMGASVSSAGDTNGDGFDDLIVGAPSYSAGQAFEGAAFVFLGSAAGVSSGDPSTASAQIESDQATSFLGQSVATAGDVDGDGYDDVIVGASSYENGEVGEGAAFVFLGGGSGVANGDPTTAYAGIEADQANASLGCSVASAGDVNGDGYDDVIAGAFLYDASIPDGGAAFIALGGGAVPASGSHILRIHAAGGLLALSYYPDVPTLVADQPTDTITTTRPSSGDLGFTYDGATLLHFRDVAGTIEVDSYDSLTAFAFGGAPLSTQSTTLHGVASQIAFGASLSSLVQITDDGTGFVRLSRFASLADFLANAPYQTATTPHLVSGQLGLALSPDGWVTQMWDNGGVAQVSVYRNLDDFEATTPFYTGTTPYLSPTQIGLAASARPFPETALLFGAEGTGASLGRVLYSIDPETAVSSNPLTFTRPADGALLSFGTLEFSPKSGVLYATEGIGASEGRVLYRVSPGTAEGWAIGDVTRVGDGVLLNFTSIAAHPTTGVLYGSEGIGSGGGVTLYTIDAETAAAVDVGNFRRVGDLAPLQFTSIDFDAAGRLYGSEGAIGTGRTLYEIDAATALATPIGNFQRASDGADLNIVAIEFSPDTTTLYGAEAIGGGLVLYTIDPTNAVGTVVDGFLREGDGAVLRMQDLAMPVPEPGLPASVGGAVLAASWIARRRGVRRDWA
ncbi:MAG: FG-GAP repeat protein [Myxococcales bacterium]|nr:FG-GAP repeat protein [Myxococcales bacterium]